MSRKIWQDLQDAVKEARPSLAKDFYQCRTGPDMRSFLDKHLPHPILESWDNELLTRAPEIIKMYFPPELD